MPSRAVFADTFYWVAFTNPKDQWHAAVRALRPSLQLVRLVTTDEVLTEFANWFAAGGADWRRQIVPILQTILASPTVTVVPQSRESFLSGLELYQRRADKAYSLTDCISMETMRRLGLTEVLTHDRHFSQEGFQLLL
jgi:predicted nucleic acid-binding protein